MTWDTAGCLFCETPLRVPGAGPQRDARGLRYIENVFVYILFIHHSSPPALSAGVAAPNSVPGVSAPESVPAVLSRFEALGSSPAEMAEGVPPPSLSPPSPMSRAGLFFLGGKTLVGSLGTPLTAWVTACPPRYACLS